jgi:hypothetical protein
MVERIMKRSQEAARPSCSERKAFRSPDIALLQLQVPSAHSHIALPVELFLPRNPHLLHLNPSCNVGGFTPPFSRTTSPTTSGRSRAATRPWCTRSTACTGRPRRSTPAGSSCCSATSATTRPSSAGTTSLARCLLNRSNKARVKCI